MQDLRHATVASVQPDLLSIANRVAGWARTKWCEIPANNGMEFALPLVAAVARHIHFAMGAFSKGDLVGAAAFSSAADACFRRASEYHSDIDGFNDFTSLRDSIEEMLKGDLPEAQKHAGEFVASMLDYEKRIVGKGGEPLRPPAKMP